ncbi:energy transducer TonB [Brumimicrobium aurantiacum]|uniref:Energy transducer TonB n=1 Tax=Brumimicrobium aurantiacum TaxID=1737063 RepID=A0A3E1EX47_9FLAO|nr:energy transducer TonB [Brumimicrobium aurantiacum]RFC54102.1 energy transducer TonB [Brumimicrobium aurantiacum]
MESKKNPQVDNEKLRLPLIFLGFFIVGSLVTLSFSFKEEVAIVSDQNEARERAEIPEELEVVEEPKEEPVVQEVEEPEITPPPSEEIEVKKNEDKDEPIVVETPPIDIEPEEEPEPEAPIVDYPDKEAGFPGGMAAMKKFLAENVKYPEVAMEMGDQGKVFLEFVVDKDGSITQVKILRGVSREIDAEARRVVRQMPKWAPGEANGEPVRTRCRIPINFTLQ